jgi:hypothetical protein
MKSFDIGSSIGFISSHNLDLHIQDSIQIKEELDTMKKTTNSMDILKTFWMYPGMWKYLGESRKNIFSEGIKHGVFLDKLYDPKFIDEDVIIEVGRSGSMDLANNMDSKIKSDKIIYKRTEMTLRGIFMATMEQNIGIDWKTVSRGAAHAGHQKFFLEILETHISKIALYFWFGNPEDGQIIGSPGYWNDVLRSACAGGSFNIVRIAIEHGADNWRSAFRGACGSSNIELIDFLLHKIKSDENLIGEINTILTESEIMMCMEIACVNGQFETLKYFIRLFKHVEVEISDLLEETGYDGNISVIRFLVNHPSFGFKESSVVKAISNTSLSGSINCVQYLLETFPQVINEDNLRKWMLLASRNGHMNLMNYLVETGADNFEEATISANKLNHYF